jgi:hypothetical protein
MPDFDFNVFNPLLDMLTAQTGKKKSEIIDDVIKVFSEFKEQLELEELVDGSEQKPDNP